MKNKIKNINSSFDKSPWRKITMFRRLSHSQNFLKSRKLVSELIKKSGINLNDIVYEIGPGKGIITEELANFCREVIAIEADRKLFSELSIKFKYNQKIKIVSGNFLDFILPNRGQYKIFSNIPFNLTADIIGKITMVENPAVETYFIIQKEAALKFAGHPYYKESQYSLLLKPVFEFNIIAKLQRSDFQPQPSVDTVLLQIKKRKNSFVDQTNFQLYRDFIIHSFGQWKPTLKQGLGKIFTGIQYDKLSQTYHFSKNSKPTDLNFEQWIGIFRYFISGVSVDKKSLVFGSESRLKRQQSKLQKIHRTRKYMR